ncbi:MAG: LamG-like jellyroll fold domain-containing protein [Pseudobacter sp.]|uniref:LamG-like jellyroll fold domain-containing protein n=1 Tax=Pseudobacter sp. TaxID=2045420 RepID=UPI003F7CFB89
MLVIGLLSAVSTYATNFVVSSLANTGAGTLRAAITAANADASGPHTITFSVTGVINLTTSLPVITRMMTIDGIGQTVTLSGPGGDNHIALITLGTGSSGSTIKNLILRNTGLEPVLMTAALSDVTLEKLTLLQTGTHYANHGIMANAAVTNLTIREVTMTGLQDSFVGVLFRAAVTNLTMDKFSISGGGGVKGVAMQFLAAVNGANITNSLFDMDDPATADDGDYAVQFNTNTTNVTFDNCIFRDAEIYSLHFKAGVTTNFTIKNSTFDNLDGSGTVQMLRFETATKLVGAVIDNNTFNADFRNNINDGDYGAVLASENQENIQLTNNRFIEHDGAGVQIGGNHADNTDKLTISGNAFTNNGTGAATHGGLRLYVRNATSDVDSVRIFQNTFNNSNGFGIAVFGGNNVQSTVARFAIRNNTIINSKTANGGIRILYVNKVVISQNSIYNNIGKGIELGTGGNCAYEGANTPQIISSTETSAGVYSLVVKMPAICGAGNCSLEIFSNSAKATGVGGQHYVTTRTGLGQGNQTITGVTGTFPEINVPAFGTWTATLKLNNNCGTSEFSNKIRVKIIGPAGVNAGIKLWLRGEDILAAGSTPTATGQLISGWDELSGGGGPGAMTIINNPMTKLNGINFNPVADMDGDVIRGAISGVPSWITNNTLTTVAAFNPFSISANGDRYFVLYSQSGIDYNTNHAQIEFYRSGDNILGYRGNTAINPAYAGLTGIKSFNRPGIFTSYTTATNHSSYYNGASLGTAAYNKGNFAISQWFVGGGYGPDGNGGNNWYYGAETDFAEVFTYNRNLTAPELQKVHSYMALKYGIAMKQSYVLSNAVQVWDITANAAYSKQIAGLVRDDVSVLEQKQAKAFHTDEVVTFSVGAEVAATNKDNISDITNDLSVLMWGNDSTSTAFTVPYNGTTANTRMTRKWKVQRSNWADQDITVKLDKGEEGHFLLISTDPTFTTGVQELPLNAAGTFTFNSSLLADGIYFTFGREQKAPGGVLTGLDAWTRADVGLTLSGNATTAWEDYGPSMRVWNKTTHATTIDLSPAAMNYNPALIFKGLNTSYFTYSPLVTTGYTQGEVFSVQSSAVNNVAGFPFQLGGASGTTEVWYRYTDNNMYLHWGTNARRNFSFGTKNMALPAILNVNTAANSWTASLDGKVMLGPAAYPTSFASTGTSSAIGVGYASFFNGPISEVILYKRKLNATERSQVNSYMALRYGITLDQTTATDYIASDGVTKMWTAADNGVYKNNIAGIGRDYKGSLLQKQSRSINTAASGNIIAMAAGTELASTNLLNTDTITNDKSFLTWADNNGAVTYTTAVTGEKVTLRMPRVWKVDKTNWADRDVTIKLFGGVSNAYLLIGNDETFATFNQEIPVNADSTITLNSDLLTDGVYFTFAKELKGPGFVNNGVQFWLRADDGTSSGASWNDFSGNDNNALQATAASQPLFVNNSVNFNPSFKLDGVNDFMDFSTNAGISGANQFTIVSVVKRNSISTADAILGQQSVATGSMASLFTPANKYGYTITNVNTLSSTGTYATAKVPMLNATTRAAANAFAIYTNGSADGSGTFPTFTALTLNLRLGQRAGGTDQFDGDINEVVVYNRALSATELQQANSYLALKYGITLNNGATDYIATDGVTKMWTASKNGSYNKNIAGLGRDEKTSLFQKQSRSANDSTITIVAGAVVEADNLTNTSDIGDLSFFTWADNNGSTSFATSVTSVANATNRMARVWKVDRTNWTDQDITIKVKPGGERYLLIHNTDATFGAGTAEHQINTMNGTVTLNTSELPDGAYFTIATKIVGPGCVNTGIAMWLRSDYAAETDSWIDFSGNQASAAQSNATLAPDFNTTMNYNPAYAFNGTNDVLVIPNASITGKFPFGASARTVIGVGTPTAAASGYGMMLSYGLNGTGTAQYIGQTGTNQASYGGYNSATYNISGAVNGMPLNNANILAGQYNGTAASLHVNGKADGTLTTAWNTNSTTDAWIGMGVTGTQYYVGKLGEVIVYNRALNATETQRVNSYLALKYGVTLDQATPTDYLASDGATTMWKASDNTGYNLRITGIGRDDCQSLYQKQSISTHAGILAVAMGDSVATTNLTNAAEITNDNSYFVFGDNNGAVTYSTPVTGFSNITTVMPRTWKVDKTNFTDAGITLKLTGGTDKVYLVMSADNTFDATDATYQLDATGTVQISTADIPDGAYFTFGKQLNGPGYVNVGVALWLRADDNVSTNEAWLDFSGNDNDATQATAAQQPVFTSGITNYNPGYEFNGTSQNMAMTVSKFPLTNTARTLIAVGTPNNVTGNRYMFGWGTNTTSNYNSLINVGAVATYSGFGNDVPGSAASAAIGVTQELTATWLGGSNTAAFLYNRNRQLGTALKTLSTGSGGAFIGKLSDNTQYWSGSMNEIIVYSRAIADFERLRISSYLSLKYGYTLDQTAATNYVATDWNGTTGTIYWNGTTNASNNKNIAGIGRDDKTGLYQKQSRSVNTAANGNMVAMGLNSIESTNAANTATLDDDMSFLVWGDDGQMGVKNTEYPAALDPGGCSKITRLSREWKVQKTGNVNSLQLKMFLAGLVPSSTASSDIKLLIDADGDFSAGATTITDPSAYDAATQTVTFDNVNFNDGEYFTLVVDLTNQAPGGIITNLYTWYRGDKGINATGTVLNNWYDQSASNVHLTPAVAGTSNPAYNGLINFNPTLNYDGTNDVMINSAITHNATAGEDIFAVVLPNAVAAQHDIVGLGTLANTNTALELRFDANRLQYLANNGAVASITSTATSNGIVQLANGNRSGAGAASLLMNGTTVATGTIAQFPNATQINIGSRRAAAANSFYFNGQIAEVAVYKRQLSASERIKVASYFALKFGITLPHDYIDPANTVMWSSATNTGFGYNITGIGRDDCNGLHQKQSKSVNTAEALVTLGHGLGISATNAANSNTMDNNTSFIIGDNNGARNAFTATGAPAGRERIAREWKVQETGTLGTVTIQVPANTATGVKLPLERDGAVYLLVKSDNDFTTGAIEVPMTLNGTNWETTYDFTTGDHFTFATNDECVSTTALLSNYNEVTTATIDKCYVNGWILFKNPTDPSQYIAAIYDPAGLIDRTRISALVDVDANLLDLGKGSSTQAARLMRRLLQIDCASCYDAVANPAPGFTVRMFIDPNEKAGAESGEANSITDIKATYSLTDPSVFKWFKASGKTANEVVSGLTANGGIAAGGQEWADGVLPTGQADGVDYVDFTGVNGFSTFGGIWLVNMPQALPVTWQHVQATPVDSRTILVKWSTASEQNNAGFTVERSEDATNFVSIATVNSRGNSNTVANYSFNDNKVLPGIKYYYRIRQTDFDGRTATSKIVTASLDAQGGFYMRIAQNPVRNQLYVEVAMDKQQKLQTFITDVNGKVLGSRVMTVQQGKSTIASDVSSFSDGVYFIKVVTADGKTRTEKFTIQKGR